MAKHLILILFSLGAIVASPTVSPDSEEDVVVFNSSILDHGSNPEELISLGTFNTIMHEPVDYNRIISNCNLPASISPKNGLRDERVRWYNFNNGKITVLAYINPSYDDHERDLVYAAMVEIEQTTCIQFNVQPNDYYLRRDNWDYVEITNDVDGCFSEGLGRLGQGRQKMNLQRTDSEGRTCMIKGIAVHELLHVIGFHHQQNAPDRDDYVEILWNNLIQEENVFYQFRKLSYDVATTFGTGYDFGSIMHYGPTDFSPNNRYITIRKRDPRYPDFGQRERISDIDALKVNRMHGCSS